MAKPYQNLNIFQICIRNPYRASLILLALAYIFHTLFYFLRNNDWQSTETRTEECSKCGGVVRFSIWDKPPRSWFAREIRSVEVNPASDCPHVWSFQGSGLNTSFWGGPTENEDPLELAARPFFTGLYASSALLFIYGLVGTTRRGDWP